MMVELTSPPHTTDVTTGTGHQKRTIRLRFGRQVDTYTGDRSPIRSLEPEETVPMLSTTLSRIGSHREPRSTPVLTTETGLRYWEQQSDFRDRQRPIPPSGHGS